MTLTALARGPTPAPGPGGEEGGPVTPRPRGPRAGHLPGARWSPRSVNRSRVGALEHRLRSDRQGYALLLDATVTGPRW